jgi:PAS domain S-box-containing protein
VAEARRSGVAAGPSDRGAFGVEIGCDHVMVTPTVAAPSPVQRRAPTPGRDLIAIALTIAIGSALATAFGVTEQLLGAAAALEDHLGIPMRELPGVLAIAACAFAVYYLRRGRQLRSAAPSHDRTAEQLRAALEQARSAEERAESAQRRLIEAIETIPEGFTLFDAEDRYVLWNSKYIELYAESADLVRVGARFADVLRLSVERGQFPAAEGRLEEWLAERLALHANQHGTHEQQLQDGRWLRIAERRLHDGGSIGVRIDITELKRRETSIRLLFEDNPVPMYVFDRDTLRFLEVNHAALIQYGYTRDQFLKMSLDDIRPRDEVPRLRAALNEVDGAEFARLGRWRHRRADDAIIFVETMGHTLRYNDRPASIVAAVDVTDQARAEEALRQSETRLRQSEQHLANAQRVAAIGSWELDAQTFRFRWSDELYRIHELPPSGEVLDLERVLGLIHPDDRAKVRKAIERAVAGVDPKGFDFRIVRPSGGIRTLHCEGEPIRNGEGATIGLIGTAQDVTDARRADRERRNLEHQLIHAQRMDALGTLAGGIAHDLNNALVPILALTKRLRDRLPPDNSERTSLDIVLRAGQRARDLVKQVLAFSRKETTERQAVDLAALLGETMTMLRASLPTSIQLVQRLAEVPPTIGDPSQLHQVIINLVTNAAYAIGAAKGRIEVELRRSAEGNGIELVVRDTGTGMDPETMQRIFDPFFTTKPVGEGTGLGLSVVHGIVASHQGRIRVDSRLGEGTEFVVTLPQAA